MSIYTLSPELRPKQSLLKTFHLVKSSAKSDVKTSRSIPRCAQIHCEFVMRYSLMKALDNVCYSLNLSLCSRDNFI